MHNFIKWRFSGSEPLHAALTSMQCCTPRSFHFHAVQLSTQGSLPSMHAARWTEPEVWSAFLPSLVRPQMHVNSSYCPLATFGTSDTVRPLRAWTNTTSSLPTQVKLNPAHLPPHTPSKMLTMITQPKLVQVCYYLRRTSGGNWSKL